MPLDGVNNKRKKLAFKVNNRKFQFQEIGLPIYLKSEENFRQSEVFVIVTYILIYIYGFYFFKNDFLKILSLVSIFLLLPLIRKEEIIKSFRSIIVAAAITTPFLNYFVNFHSNENFIITSALVSIFCAQFFFYIINPNRKYLSYVNNQIKNYLFFKNESFANSPKWDLISFKLFFPSMTFLILISRSINCNFNGIRETSEIKEYLYVLGLVGTNYMSSFVHLSNAKAAKYKHLYDQYNKVLETRSTKKEIVKNYTAWEVSLAIDMLDFDLWAHKSFQEYFCFHLDEAVKCLKSNLEILNNNAHKDIHALLQKNIALKIKDNNLTIVEASLILNYHFQLLMNNYFEDLRENNEETSNILPFRKNDDTKELEEKIAKLENSVAFLENIQEKVVNEIYPSLKKIKF